MQAKKDCTSHTPSTSSPASASSASAFTAEFLRKIRRLQNPPSARQASLAGPWEVEPVMTENNGLQFAVSRRDEPFAKGGGVLGLFPTRSSALQLGAVLPAVGQPSDLHLNANGHRLGFALHDGEDFLGHLARDEERLVPHLHLARCLAADPASLAMLMESAGPEALALLGRALHRRLQAPSR